MVDVPRYPDEAELQRTMDFLTGVLVVTPTTSEMCASVRERVPRGLLYPDGRILTDAEIDSIAADEEIRFVLREVNARKPVRMIYGEPRYMAEENINGWLVNTKRGELGLTSLRA